MDTRARNDALVMIAGILGLVAGRALLERFAVERVDETVRPIDVAGLGSVLALSHRAARVTRLDSRAVMGRSVLAFLAGVGTVAARPLARHALRSSPRRRPSLPAGVRRA